MLVAGGTGRLGTILVDLLSGRDEEVRILSRHPRDAEERRPGVQVVVGDVRDRQSLGPAVDGVPTVISAITGFGMARDVSPATVDRDGNANLIQAAKSAGVQHFILLSVRQAAADHPIELFRMKYEAEQELRGSGLDGTVIRPSAYMETWVELLGVPLQRQRQTRVFGRGENPINFVSVRDVAGVVHDAASDRSMRGRAVDIGGPENVTMNGIVERFTAITGAEGKVSHVPLPMMRVMSRAMKPFNPALARVVATAVVMDTQDMSFDPSASLDGSQVTGGTTLREVIEGFS
jgi:NADH dehydrogenase